MSILSFPEPLHIERAIDPAGLELPPTQPIDITALLTAQTAPTEF